MTTTTILLTIFLAACLGLFEIILPASRLNQTWQRKIVHVGMCLAVVGLAFYFPYQLFPWIGLIFGSGLLLLRKCHPLKSLTDRFSESYGEIFLPLGIAAAALIAQSSRGFQAAILILGLADTAAYIGGKYFVSPQLMFHKTLTGSSAFVIVSIAIAALIQPSMAALATGLVLGFVELLSPRGSDNFTIPVVAIYLLGTA